MSKPICHYRYNEYTQRYYVQMVECGDEHLALNATLHNNLISPIIPDDPRECGYCGCVFSSRNQLFNHLGTMNIDIRPPSHHNEHEYVMTDITIAERELGTEGYCNMNRLRTLKHKIKKFTASYCKKKRRCNLQTSYARILGWRLKRQRRKARTFSKPLDALYEVSTALSKISL